MSKTMVINETVTMTGITAQARVVTLTADDVVASEVSVPAALPGTLTTRTDANTGVLTMTAGHGLTTGKIDVFWATGSRHGMDGTVTVNSIAIDGGAGDDLPDAATAITACAPTVQNVAFAGDDAVGALAYSDLGTPPNTGDFDGWVVFTLTDGTVVASFRVTALVPSNSWDGVGVSTNPFAGQAVTKVRFSHGNTSARTMGAGVIYDD